MFCIVYPCRFNCSLWMSGRQMVPHAFWQMFQSDEACDTCKNKPVHEATPFRLRPLSTNSQKSCCSRTTYQNEVKKTQGTNACNNRGIVFWTSRIIRKTQNQHSWMKRPCKKYMAIRLKTTHMYMESSKGSGWKVHNGLKHGRVRSWAQFLFPK